MSDQKSKIVHMWSGPRSLSTAVMYSFGHRNDTEVYDEPLYAAWLARNPYVFRPYREELLSKHETDGSLVMKSIAEYDSKPLLFCKHIAKQYRGLDKSPLYCSNVVHVFLIRNPLEMIQGWERRNDVHKEDLTMEALGLNMMCELYSDIRQHTNKDPIVLDADLLLSNPPYVLRLLCEAIGVEFDEKQLHWEAGPKPWDGLWAPYWYSSVHKSTSFGNDSAAATYPKYVKEQLTIYQEVLPFYQFFLPKALGYNILSPHSSSPAFSTPSQSVSLLDHGILVTSKLGDVRNRDVLVWVGGGLVPRYYGRVSVFDSAVQGGDAVWEGLRVYQGKIFKLQEHLDRLRDSAKGMAFRCIPSREYIRQAIFTTLAANGMTDSVHIRLTLTRGVKVTSSMNPVFNCYGCTLIVLPEYKPVGDQTTYDNSNGIKLITASNRRNSPQCVDSKIHHCNLINNILPKIQANNAGAADALMLDLEGFVSETNATNVFIVKKGVVITPLPDACLPGITRQTVISLCRSLSIPLEERRVSLQEFYIADEVFTTGTMGELTPVQEIDGREIGPIEGGESVLRRLQGEYRKLTEREGELLPF